MLSTSDSEIPCAATGNAVPPSFSPDPGTDQGTPSVGNTVEGHTPGGFESFPTHCPSNDPSPDTPTPENIAAEAADPQTVIRQAETAAANALRQPRDVTPKTLTEAKEIVRVAFLDNSTCKSILKSLKVTGVQNAKLVTKLTAIAMKMTQSQFCVKSALEFIDRIEEGEEANDHFLSNTRPSAAKITKNTSGKENIVWIRGAVPVITDDGEVQANEPELTGTNNEYVPVAREPDFEAAEYCRMLHVLADTRLTAARARLMEPRTREELDGDPIDPWTDDIAPLFNDETFKPQQISMLAGGVTRADIANIDPSKRPHQRDGGVLKRKFGEFKSAYGTSLSKYEASWQGDPDSFVHFANAKTYLMYAFCFLKQHPLL